MVAISFSKYEDVLNSNKMLELTLMAFKIWLCRIHYPNVNLINFYALFSVSYIVKMWIKCCIFYALFLKISGYEI